MCSVANNWHNGKKKCSAVEERHYIRTAIYSRQRQSTMASWIVPFIASAIFCIQADATQLPKEVEDFKAKDFEECRVKFNLPRRTIKRYLRLESVRDLVDHKCFIKCVTSKYEFFTEEGKLDRNVVMQTAKTLWPPEDHPRNIVVAEYCLDTVKDPPNACLHIYNFVDCFFTLTKKLKAAGL